MINEKCEREQLLPDAYSGAHFPGTFLPSSRPHNVRPSPQIRYLINVSHLGLGLQPRLTP